MTSKEYNTIVAEIKERLAKLEAAQPVEDPPETRYVPERDERYYFVTDFGGVLCSVWKDDNNDNGRLDIGNVFRTVEEARREAERLCVIAEMKTYWANNGLYRIVYNPYNNKIELNTTMNLQKLGINYGELRFLTENDARRCIDAIGETRLEKYYFRVNDELPLTLCCDNN